MAHPDLCDRCKSIPARLFQPVDEDSWSLVIKQSKSYSQLQASAAGCHLCRIFLSYIDDYVDETYYVSRENLIRDNPAIVLKTMHEMELDQRQKVYVAISDKKWEEIEEKDYVTPLSNTLNLCYPGDETQLPFLDHALDSPESFALAKQWINHCLETHDGCLKSRSAFLPTRLIEVGKGDNIRLVLTSDLCGNSCAYTTLSYCWGLNPNPSARTTASNIQERLQSIPLNSLPQTIQDAITISRGLGVPYIWVDALCILQDSIDDWRKESAVMGDVYSNSYCTIAATTAVNSDAGCLQKTLLSEQACQLSWEPADAVHESSQVMIYPEKISPKRYLASCALSKRAWTLQEMVLSRRVLHCTKNGLLWSCKTLQASEQDPGIEPSVSDPFDEVLRRVDEMEFLVKPYKQWRMEVEDFSRRSLTYVTDRLPALAGLAKRLQVETGDTYLAGLWKGCLAHDLTWHRHRTDPLLISCPSYISPSWSWASRLGTITACYREITNLIPVSGDKDLDTATAIRILEKKNAQGETRNVDWTVLQERLAEEGSVFILLNAEVEVQGGNPFGAVSSGILQIRSNLGKAIVIPGDGNRDRFAFEMGQFPLDLKRVEEETCEVEVIGSWVPDCETVLGEVVYYLQLTSDGIGLILKQVGPGNTFERIGLGGMAINFIKSCNSEIVSLI